MNFFDKSKAVICFLRHGQTDWNLKKLIQGRDEVPLNETGLSQAQWVAQGLKEACERTGLKFDRVISSPLGRASVTAKTIAEKIGCDDFSTDERLIERDFGEQSGKTYDFNSPFIIGNDDSIKGLEPVENVLLRMQNFIKEVAKPGKHIIAVTHGSSTAVLTKRTKKRYEKDKIESVLHNCHMVIFSYDGCELLVEGYNVSPENLDNLEL
jgi:broad specificity phosphatase PhoE